MAKTKTAVPSFLKKKDRSRVWEIDALRGALILLVVFDHICFDFFYFFDYTGPFGLKIAALARDYIGGQLRTTAHDAVVSLFVLLSGISASFTRNHFYRAVKMSLVAMLITLGTLILQWSGLSSYDSVVWFGIIHCLAAAMIIYALIDLTKMPGIIVIIFAILSLLVGYYFINNPIQTQSNFLIIFVFNKNYHISADYFPILPYLGWFLIGVYLGKGIYREKKSIVCLESTGAFRPLNFCGRHSLAVYILSQFVAYTLSYIIYVTGV